MSILSLDQISCDIAGYNVFIIPSRWQRQHVFQLLSGIITWKNGVTSISLHFRREYFSHYGLFSLTIKCVCRSTINGITSSQGCCKWNESGFRPPLCTYRLNWAKRTSRGWWDEWDDTVLQTQDSKFEPWRSEAEHATSRSRRLSTIVLHVDGEETFFYSTVTDHTLQHFGIPKYAGSLWII